MRHPFAALLLALSGCGSPHLRAGNLYMEQGRLPLAVELLDAGAAKEPESAELKDALILAEQTLHYELRQEIDDLKSAGQSALALKKLLELEESARRAARHHEPSEDPAALEKERRQLIGETITALQRGMDERAGRGVDVKADLGACRELLAMVEDDPAIARMCERLRARFKLVAITEAEAGADPAAARVLEAVKVETKKKNPELLELVEASANRHNAVIRLYLGAPETRDSGWLLVGRDAFHEWVPQKTPRGEQVEESVTVQPSREEIEEAQRKKQPPPKAKQVKKKVYQEIAGEHRRFRAERTVSLPYRLVIENLRDDTLVLELAGVHRVAAESAYFEYEGDPRGANHNKPSAPHGRKNAAPLTPAEQLVARATKELPDLLVNAILEGVE